MLPNVSVWGGNVTSYCHLRHCDGVYVCMLCSLYFILTQYVDSIYLQKIRRMGKEEENMRTRIMHTPCFILRFSVGSQFCQINWSSPIWHSVFFSFKCYTWICCAMPLCFALPCLALLCFALFIHCTLWPIRITSLSIWFHFMFKLKINTIFGRLFVQPENWNDDSKLVIT